jgi:hypothetical protein
MPGPFNAFQSPVGKGCATTPSSAIALVGRISGAEVPSFRGEVATCLAASGPVWLSF